MARKLGAIHYIDSQSQNAAEELVKFASNGKKQEKEEKEEREKY
jgi:hypothetical protein